MKVKYAKIKETVAIGCMNTKHIPNNKTDYNPWTKKPFLPCKTGFKKRTESQFYTKMETDGKQDMNRFC